MDAALHSSTLPQTQADEVWGFSEVDEVAEVRNFVAQLVLASSGLVGNTSRLCVWNGGHSVDFVGELDSWLDSWLAAGWL